MRPRTRPSAVPPPHVASPMTPAWLEGYACAVEKNRPHIPLHACDSGAEDEF